MTTGSYGPETVPAEFNLRPDRPRLVILAVRSWPLAVLPLIWLGLLGLAAAAEYLKAGYRP